jgi:hypothetical protein
VSALPGPGRSGFTGIGHGGGIVHFGWVPGQTGGVTSKYDSYWAARLGEIRAGAERAAAGLPAVVGLPGLRGAGERASWYGIAEVRGRGVTRDSMAHVTSLGRAVAASGMCAAWPQCVFRFTITAAGDTLTITAAQSRSGQQDGRRSCRQDRRAAPPAPASPASSPPVPRDAPPADRGGLDETAVSRFYLALGQLAQVLPGGAAAARLPRLR